MRFLCLFLLMASSNAFAISKFRCVPEAGSTEPLLGEQVAVELSDHGGLGLKFGKDKSCGRDLGAAKMMKIKVGDERVAVRQMYIPKDYGCDILFAMAEKMLVGEPGILRIKVGKATTFYTCSKTP